MVLKSDIDHRAILLEKLQLSKGKEPAASVGEGSRLEFKEGFNWDNREKYAKTMAAFANNAGGYLLFGVQNRTRKIVGMSGNGFANLDDAQVTEYLSQNYSQELVYERASFEVANRKIGFIYVQRATRKPVMCIKKGTEQKEGDIFYRYRARSCHIRHTELDAIIRQLEDAVDRRWKQHVAQIVRLGAAEALVVKKSEKPDAKAESVTVVSASSNPSAPTYQLSERQFRDKFPLSYTALLAQVKSSSEGLKQDRLFNKVMKEIKRDPALCYKRLLDPGNPKSSGKNWFSKSAVATVVQRYNSATR